MLSVRWIGFLLAAGALSACVVVSEREARTYDIAGFDSVSATSGVNVVLRQGAFAVSAEGPKNKLDRLSIERRGETLVIAREPDLTWFEWSTDPDIVTVVAPSFVSIEASGGADVDVRSLTQDALRVRTSGGADVNFQDGLRVGTLDADVGGGADLNAEGVEIGVFTATVSGGGDLNVSGACKSANVTSSGGADFNGGDLRCETAIVVASGGADAEIGATASASGRASSGADVRFRGNPVRLEEEESGGGDVSSGL